VQAKDAASAGPRAVQSTKHTLGISHLYAYTNLVAWTLRNRIHLTKFSKNRIMDDGYFTRGSAVAAPNEVFLAQQDKEISGFHLAAIASAQPMDGSIVEPKSHRRAVRAGEG
jgi:hypothetical protein